MVRFLAVSLPICIKFFDQKCEHKKYFKNKAYFVGQSGDKHVRVLPRKLVALHTDAGPPQMIDVGDRGGDFRFKVKYRRFCTSFVYPTHKQR